MKAFKKASARSKSFKGQRSNLVPCTFTSGLSIVQKSIQKALKQYANYSSSIIFDGFVDLQNESATILGTFLLLSCDPNRVPK